MTAQGIDSLVNHLALIGDEATLRAGIERIRDSGVTDFNAAIVATEDDAYERTFEFLASLRL